jgi:CRP/FNR family transcriptional regulator, cyclic AMP receptor protein
MTYLLRNVQLFESLSDLERAELVHFMHERQLASGETVFVRGEYGNTMLVVVQGALSAVVPGRDNHNHEVARLAAGAFVGEMFCIDPAPRPVTMVASEPTTVLELSRDDLIRMRQDAPRTAANLVNAVFHEVLRRLRSVDDRIERELEEADSPPREDDAFPSPSDARSVPGPWERCFARLRGSA